MAFDFQSLLYAPVYGVLQTDIQFVSPFDGSMVCIKGIDKTSGATVLDAQTGIATIKPVVVVMKKVLNDRCIKTDFMEGVNIRMNGKSWHVYDVRPAATPNGEEDGEVYLVLHEAEELRSPF